MSDAGNYHLLKSMPPQIPEDTASLSRRVDRLDTILARTLKLERDDKIATALEMRYLAERILNIELALFPGILPALSRAKSIVGPDDGPAFNRLDIRDRDEPVS